ncbi:FAD-dependent oxidoreductase [Mesorhizobium sp. CO1-1-8]|nr:FAD-dependent oxidoreductase [Mesorhizobium sp. CO1-1-8]
MQLANSPGRILDPRIVVVGGGFAGLEVAKALGKAEIGVTIIDRHNHHLFQPLLFRLQPPPCRRLTSPSQSARYWAAIPRFRSSSAMSPRSAPRAGYWCWPMEPRLPVTYWSWQPVRSHSISARTAGLGFVRA